MSLSRALKASKELGFVACRVGETLYAIPIEEVREIIVAGNLTPIPGAPPGVIGAVDHRREVLPVLDLGLRLGLPRATESRRKWVIARVGERSIGVVVHQVLEVFHVPESEVRPAPDVGDATLRSARQVVALGSQLSFVLDLSVLAALAEMNLAESIDL